MKSFQLCKNTNAKLIEKIVLIQCGTEKTKDMPKILIEYGGKCPRTGEKRLNYLNEYTRLLGT